jgi:HK97 family phage portal protein
MGLFSGLLAPAIGATYLPTDNFWFQQDPRGGVQSQAGITASPDAAIRLGAVYACVRILADMVGSLPLHVYRRRPDDGKDRATDHPAYPLLRRRPNPYQTAIRWRQLGMRHILLRGNFFNLIVWSTRRVRELIPLNPDRMVVRLLPSGRRGYLYSGSPVQYQGGYIAEPQQVFTQDEIFHVMGFSLDGVSGCSVIEHARESVGRSLAEELYASRFWSAGGAVKGALSAEGKLSPEQRKANEEAWQQAQGGWWNSHKVALLEGGLKWQQIGVSARDAQYLEGRQFSVLDIARWFGLPPHMIGDIEKSTSWGTGIEQQFLGFLITALSPWLTLWEQEIDRQLLEDDDDLFAEFLVDAMLRTDLAARATAERQYVDGGILSVNEVRVMENRNPISGSEFEKPQRAQNIGGGGNPATTTGQRGTPGGGSQNTGQPDPSLDDPANARARDLVVRAAGRMVRKEVGAIQKFAPRYAGSPEGWREWAADFYGKHVALLGEALGLEEAVARRYGAAHLAALLEQGVTVCDEWTRHAPALLTALALGEEMTWEADAIPAS